MKRVVSIVFAVMAASAVPALGGEISRLPKGPVNPVAQPLPIHQPTNVEVLQAITGLNDQITQLQGELAAVKSKLESAETKEHENYQRLSWRIVQACKVAYLRSFKAGDNPSSGQGGNPFLPEAWCQIGSYPYWNSEP